MIKRIIATVFGIGSKPAVSTGLKKLVGSKRLAEVRARCEDKRRLLSVIADEMGVPEEQLAFAVAAKIGLPFWANVKPIDLSICADITDIEHLRRVGAIPIVSEGSISAVACVDPRLIAEQGSPLAKYQPYLSLWSNISESLATSEQRHTEQQRAKLDQERWEVLFSVLATLVEEVETYNATAEEARTVIDLSAKPITYRFRTTDRRQGSGQINQQLLNDLTELSTSHETLCLRLPNSKQLSLIHI